MQLFNSDRGVLRRSGGETRVLPSSVDLHDVLVAGDFASLAFAEPGDVVSLDDVELRPPLRPTRLFQVGLNYHSHLAEIGRPAPDAPMYALTVVDGQVASPGAAIDLPADDPDQVDYESEIAVVVGQAGRGIAAADAWEFIAGLTACNDVSARGLQRAGFATGDLTAGKMLPGFKPLGPGIVTADEASSAPIGLRLELNGEIRQQATSADMVFSIPQLIEVISADHDLYAGDVIMTGSPAGVGMFTGRFIQPGDVTEVFLGDLPPLRNTYRTGD